MPSEQPQQLENLLEVHHLYLTVFLLTRLSKMGTWCYLFWFFVHCLAALMLFSIAFFSAIVLNTVGSKADFFLKYVDSIDMVVRKYY